MPQNKVDAKKVLREILETKGKYHDRDWNAELTYSETVKALSILESALKEAAQQEAVEFAEWAYKNYNLIEAGINNRIEFRWINEGKDINYYTTEELYELFKTSQPK